MSGETYHLVEGPGIEPVTLDEAKLHLRVDTEDDDELIEALIVAARERAEDFTGCAFILQSWDLKRDYAFPDGFELKKPPLSSVTSITYVDSDGDSTTLATSQYTVDAPSGRHAAKGRIVPAYQVTWPATREVINAVTVRFEAGYGDTAEDVPEAIKLAIKIAAGHYYASRDMGGDLPELAKDLLWPFRMELI